MDASSLPSLQEICLPGGICFGCGPAHPEGLHIRSFWSVDGQYVVGAVQPDAKYTSGFQNALYGGTIASLIDCHSNWTAMAFGYRAEGREPGTQPLIASVTGSLSVRYLRPTPMNVPLSLKAWVDGEVGRKTRVICELSANGVVTALGDSVFVRIDPSLFE